MPACECSEEGQLGSRHEPTSMLRTSLPIALNCHCGNRKIRYVVDSPFREVPLVTLRGAAEPTLFDHRYGAESALARSSLQAIAPVIWPAMQVRDRQHQDVAVVGGVDQSVGEPTEAAAANAFAQRVPRPRKARDAIRSGQHLNQKRIAQARRLRSVPVDGLIEFDLGNFKKPDRHGRYLATMSLRSLAASSPRR